MGSVPKTIPGLIERFGRNVDAYRAGRYNETEVRHDFIDPLFEALGWDINNRAGYAEAYRDVIHEDAIKIGGATKAPDYCFRVGGTRKFFVEAKKPSVDIARDVHPAYQLRRYAWSAKLPLSILTDFEELAVYDCRIRPKRTDKAAVARTIYLTYDQYADKWDDIAAIFAKEAILQGSFDKYVVGRKKRGTAEVDAEFLKEIEKWRGALARNIALRNRKLNVREINFAVQRTIDRIIFLRMAEDRGVEDYATLQPLINGTDVYGRLMQMFRAADDRYNSGLFHFNDEPRRDQPPDTLTPDLNIDDKVLKDIFKGLYYPDSPYEFSVLPADILGSVYEQFLGKVIRLTPGHQARVEEKPEVKKAGGVYYTPKYIVDYIVKHTVGRLLLKEDVAQPPSAEQKQTTPQPGAAALQDIPSIADNFAAYKTPQHIGGLTARFNRSKTRRALRILDPACGSGSFLIGAYRRLLDYHRDWYVADGPEKHTKRIYQGLGGQWYLTTEEKKRVLLGNIYGVDIDPQAVEVTKLNLLLCVLENETQGSIGQLALFHQRVLPDLGDNIKCGNSLIGPDFYEGKQLSLFDEEARYRINAFDWQAEFPQVFKGKNPGFDAVIGNPPYLSFSGRQAVELSEEVREYFKAHYRAGGWFCSHALFIEHSVNKLAKRLVSFIVPDQVGHLSRYEGVRAIVDKGTSLVEVRYWGENVFHKVVTPVLTFVADRVHKTHGYVYDVDGCNSLEARRLGDAWISRSSRELLSKLAVKCDSLGSLIADPGVHTGNCSRKIVLDGTGADGLGVVPVLEGKQVSRYCCRQPTKLLRLDYPAGRGEYFTIRPKEKYASASFVVRQTAPYPIVGPREHAVYFRNSLLALYPSTDGTDVRYLVGLLNSRLIRYIYSRSVREGQQKAFPQVKVKSLRALPIRRIDFRDPRDKAQHDRIADLVDQMLSLKRDLLKERTPQGQCILRRQAAHIDQRIDEAVYALYDLDAQERQVVESCTESQ